MNAPRSAPRIARRLALLCAAAALALATPAARAAGQPEPEAGSGAQPPGVVMHRQGAGQPDASGWSDAHSTAGRFAVSVPGHFDDFTVKDTARDGTPETVHVIGAGAKGGVRFAAVCVVRADLKVDPDVLARLGKIPGARTPAAVTVGGLVGVEVQASHEGNAAVMRALRGEDRVYLLTVEFPATDAAAVLPQARRFMESFKVE
jgi:hypothetical protein